MDYQQGQYANTQNEYSQKMPFYMTYPMQNVLLEEAEYERDIARFKGMYPKEVRTILYFVEEECDKMEYEGSLMFDEYPDRSMLKQLCNKIYDNYMKENVKASEYDEIEAEELRMVRRYDPVFDRRFHDHHHRGRNFGIDGLIEVLLFNEINNRRCRHRRCHRWW